MSEEEKRTKKQKIEDNRRLRALSQNSAMFSSTPSSSPPVVPETEHFFSPTAVYRKRRLHDGDDDDDDSDHDHQNTMHSFDDVDELPDIKPSADILNQFLNGNNMNYRSSLAEDDQQLLKNIEQNYARGVRLNISVIRGYTFPCIRNLNDITDVVNEPAQMSSLRLITFLKLTPEFHVCLHSD